MSLLEGLPVNFTISDRAKAEFEVIRHLYRDQSDDPPAVLMIGWGTTFFDAGGTAEGVVVGYYGESQRAEDQQARRQRELAVRRRGGERDASRRRRHRCPRRHGLATSGSCCRGGEPLSSSFAEGAPALPG